MTKLEQYLFDRCEKLGDFAKLKLKEDWGMGADPIKLIGLAEEIGMQDLADEFKEQLKEDKEHQASIKEYFEPTLKTFSNH
jgi:hypothetical protein